MRQALLFCVALTFLLVSCIATPTPEITSEVTEIEQWTETPTQTNSPTTTSTLTLTFLPTLSPSLSPSVTKTHSPTVTNTASPSLVLSPTITKTITPTPTASPTFKPATIEPTPSQEFICATETCLRSCIALTTPRICTITTLIISTKRLTINTPNLLIRGQGATAGITNGVSNIYPLLEVVDTHDVVIENLRLRRTPNTPGLLSSGADGLNLVRCERIVVSHVSVAFGIDGGVDVNSCQDVVITDTIIAESLHCSSHVKLCHSTGAIAYWSTNVTYCRTLFVSNNERNPRVASSTVNVLSSWIVNFGATPIVVTADNAPSYVNVKDTVFTRGVDSPQIDYGVAFSGQTLPANIWIDNPLLVRSTDRGRIVGKAYSHLVDCSPASDLLASVGAWPRDSTDARIITSVVNGTAKIIDNVPN